MIDSDSIKKGLPAGAGFNISALPGMHQATVLTGLARVVARKGK